MSGRSRKASLILVLLAYTLWAYAPVFTGGFVQDDLGVLLGASRVAFSPGFELADLYAVPGSEGRPAAGLSMLTSIWVWSGWYVEGSGRWAPLDAAFLRGENLLLVLLGCWGLLHAVRRGLEPWTGREHARAAGRSAALFLAVHPLVSAAVARFDSRGDLLAVALMLGSTALFLRGRQERQYPITGLAGILAVLAGLASSIAMFLPLGLALVEYCSARRHRAREKRLRTAITTLAVFGVCVALERLPRTLLFFDAAALAAGPPPRGDLASGLLGPIAIGVEKLGVLILPAHGGGIGGIGYLLASLVVLVSLHPAFVAARSAPRLWGRLLFGWLCALALTQMPDARVRVEPENMANAETLLVASIVMATGLGMGATALSGLRRLLLPLFVATCFGVLTQAALGPIRRAGEVQEELQASLLEEAQVRGNRGTFLVLDPPQEVDGVLVQRGPLSELVDPLFLPRDKRNGREIQAIGLSHAALAAFVAEPEFTALRAEHVIVLLDPDRIDLFDEFEDEVPWLALDVPLEEPSRGKRLMWRTDASSPPDVNLDALGQRSVVVQALPDTPTTREPEVFWSASSSHVPEGYLAGAWVDGDMGPVVVFDLSRSLEWLLADRIESLWFVDSPSTIASAEIQVDIPSFEGEVAPLQRGADWTFDLGEIPIPEPLTGTGSWALGILDLETLSHRGFPVEGDAVGGLRAPGVARHVATLVGRGSGPLVWILERRVDGVAVARARGRVTR